MGGRADIDMLAMARERTLAAVSARIALCNELSFRMPPLSTRTGGLLRLAAKLATATAKPLLKPAFAKFDYRHIEANGMIDMAQRRYRLDYGRQVELYVDGKRWDTPGLEPGPNAHEIPTPMWLLDALTGTTDAVPHDTDVVRGSSCRHYAVTTDLSHASQRTPGGIAVPQRRRFEDLLALPLDVWIDDAHIRRVRFQAQLHTQTLDLWDFGVRLENIDWTPPRGPQSPQQ